VATWQRNGRNFLKQITELFKTVLYFLALFIWFALFSFFWLGLKLIEFIKWFIQDIKRLVIVLTLFFAGLTLAAILPATQNFEGQLTVQEFSFTYTGEEQNKLFLNGIRGIKEITVGGNQTLTLIGKFENKFYPQLSQLNTLQIELPEEASKLTIIPANPQELSQIELTELRLQKNTTVKGLNYNSYKYKTSQINRLSFSLQQENAPRHNSLQLELGNNPLKLRLENYRFAKLKLPSNAQELELTFQPAISQLKLPLPQNTDLSIDLPDTTKTESSQWIRGNLQVENVKFYRFDKTGIDVKDELFNSTILEGKIRMAGQERTIEKNQFLTVEKPGIKLLRNIQLHPQPSPGLEVRISGQSKRIEVGLDTRFPVSIIQASWLDGILPRDAIIALISFCAASFSYLLYWLIEQASKSKLKS